MNFNNLHQQDTPLLIGNVRDVASAKVAKRLNFSAIGTSSGAIASMLGYTDGEEISFQELEYLIKRITQTVQLPLTVDLEAGYSRKPEEIVRHMSRLFEIGVVGVNLEDSLMQNGSRTLVEADTFGNLLAQIITQLHEQEINLFINVRTDPFLLGMPNALQETIKRAKKYQQVGANGIFVPCIEKEADIAAVVQSIKLPLNVMCMPNLPDFKTLHQLGVKRISMGGFVFKKMSRLLEQELKNIQQTNSFKNVFA